VSVSRIALRGIGDKEQLQRVAESINGLIEGRLDATYYITLTANSATTVVVDTRFESSMVPVFTPTTANGAAAMGGMYVSSRGKGTFTLTHANNAQTDKSFIYVRIG
jgi:hypothetical protein